MCYSYSDIMCGFKGSFEKNNLNLLEMYKFHCEHAYLFQLCIIYVFVNKLSSRHPLNASSSLWEDL